LFFIHPLDGIELALHGLFLIHPLDRVKLALHGLFIHRGTLDRGAGAPVGNPLKRTKLGHAGAAISEARQRMPCASA
ncbi:MAG: hypothetical protein AAGK98_11090, partial [Pseudomonadota bacterium]